MCKVGNFPHGAGLVVPDYGRCEALAPAPIDFVLCWWLQGDRRPAVSVDL